MAILNDKIKKALEIFRDNVEKKDKENARTVNAIMKDIYSMRQSIIDIRDTYEACREARVPIDMEMLIEWSRNMNIHREGNVVNRFMTNTCNRISYDADSNVLILHATGRADDFSHNVKKKVSVSKAKPLFITRFDNEDDLDWRMIDFLTEFAENLRLYVDRVSDYYKSLDYDNK